MAQGVVRMVRDKREGRLAGRRMPERTTLRPTKEMTTRVTQWNESGRHFEVLRVRGLSDRNGFVGGTRTVRLLGVVDGNVVVEHKGSEVWEVTRRLRELSR